MEAALALVGGRWSIRDVPLLQTAAAAAASNITRNATTLNEELIFAAPKSVRTSTIILAAFNSIAALATALSIVHRGYVTRREMRRRQLKSASGSTSLIPTVDVFPLILSLGIVVQGIVFASAQRVGLHSLHIKGCGLLSAFVLPGILLVPLIHLVYGVEVACRALSRRPFHPRARWQMYTCLAAIAGLLLASTISAILIRTPDQCLGSLFWFVAPYAPGIFGTVFGITLLLVACMITIFVRLSRSSQVVISERVAASRMIYYQSIAVISNAFLIPFFFSLTFLDDAKMFATNLNLAMAATVVANLSGLMVGGLYLFLRSSKASSIGPGTTTLDDTHRQKLKGQIRMRSVSDASNYSSSSQQMSSVPTESPTERKEMWPIAPLPMPYDESMAIGIARTAPDFNPLGLNTVFSPITPTRPLLDSAEAGKVRTKSYSLFPREILPAGGDLVPPPSHSSRMARFSNAINLQMPILPFGKSHNRNSSLSSSATVQIGLRFSNMGDMAAIPDSSSVIDLRRTTTNVATTAVIRGPSPLGQAIITSSAVVPARSNMLTVVRDQDRPRLSRSLAKTLPPTPESAPTPPALSKPSVQLVATKLVTPKQAEMKEADDMITLSPTVYSPNSNRAKKQVKPASPVSRQQRTDTGAGAKSPVKSAQQTSSSGSAYSKESGGKAPSTARGMGSQWI